VPISRVNPPLGSCLWGPRRPRSGSVTDPLRKGGSKLSVSEKSPPCRHYGAASTRIGATRRHRLRYWSPDSITTGFCGCDTARSPTQRGVIWMPGSLASRQADLPAYRNDANGQLCRSTP
jgi:hypothetical protein